MAVLTCTHNLCFEQKKENYHIFHLKIIVFTAVKYCSILHRRVFVMIGPLIMLSDSNKPICLRTEEVNDVKCTILRLCLIIVQTCHDLFVSRYGDDLLMS